MRLRDELIQSDKRSPTRPVTRESGLSVQTAPKRIEELQRTAGNQAVTSLLQREPRHQGQREGDSAAAPVVQRVELGVDYVVSGHGWDRIHQRGISQEQLERTLDNPTVIHDDGSHHIYVSAFRAGQVCIRAIMSKDLPMTVVTVMKVTGRRKVARYVDRP